MVIDPTQLSRSRSGDVDRCRNVAGGITKISVGYACTIRVRTNNLVLIIDSTGGARRSLYSSLVRYSVNRCNPRGFGLQRGI